MRRLLVAEHRISPSTTPSEKADRMCGALDGRPRIIQAAADWAGQAMRRDARIMETDQLILLIRDPPADLARRHYVAIRRRIEELYSA